MRRTPDWPVTIPPASRVHMTQRDGYVVIDDTTGKTIAYGFGQKLMSTLVWASVPQ
jgi:hypothetical protein